MKDFVSIDDFAEEEGLKKTFWSKEKIDKDCHILSMKLKILRQVTDNGIIKYKRSIIKIIFLRMFLDKRKKMAAR